MTSISDTLTMGLVLVLLFGSIALYLYTRIQQAEQKLSLLESILLDIKMSAEIKSYSELPADNTSNDIAVHMTTENYSPFEDSSNNDEENVSHGAVVNSNPSKQSSPSKQSNPSEQSSLPTQSISHEDTVENEVDQYKSVIAEAVAINTYNSELPSKTLVNYESTTLKELQVIAKSRGITGAGSMKKSSIIEALKTSDKSPTNVVESGSLGTNGVSGATTSFLETSGTFLGPESH